MRFIDTYWIMNWTSPQQILNPSLQDRLFKKHNDEMLGLVGKDFARGTYNRYEAASRNVKSFLNCKFFSSAF